MANSRKLTFIELFAGCGGMSLGLEANGFDLYFANELSPMAGETFAYNILNENLQLKRLNKESSKNVLWLKSKYKRQNLEERLRENPFETEGGEFSDLSEKTTFNKKLLIGDVNELVKYFEDNPKKHQEIKKKNIDLLSGGPPCQGFSLAGKRIKDDYKNSLPLSFAMLANLLQPKVVILENVKGITSAFTGEDGKKYHAWLEVSKAFAIHNYIPICVMLNAKYYGAPQNRPRFILFAYRKDIFKKIFKIYPRNKVLTISNEFHEKVITKKDNLSSITIKDFKYFDIEKEIDKPFFNGEVLPRITTEQENFVSAHEAIGDIRRTDISFIVSKTISPYAKLLLKTFKSKKNDEEFVLKNHDERNHSTNVKSRFRYYQIINEFQNGLKKSAFDLLYRKSIGEEKKDQLLSELMNYNFFFKNEDELEHYRKPKSKEEIYFLIGKISTRKHSQRAIKELEPAPSQLTIPDDLCHYHMENLRTFTVREMARFQSFPDWFEFKSKITTGGTMRRFEVPQYTQVGNAVPPLLAKALGKTVKDLLMKINKNG